MEDCKKIKELIPLYVDNVLNNQQKKMVIDHCIRCDDCAHELDYYKRYFSLFRGHRPVEAPEGFIEKIHERLEKPDPFKRMYRFLFEPLPIKIPLGITGFATALLFVFVIMRGLTFDSFYTQKSASGTKPDDMVMTSENEQDKKNADSDDMKKSTANEGSAEEKDGEKEKEKGMESPADSKLDLPVAESPDEITDLVKEKETELLEKVELAELKEELVKKELEIEKREEVLLDEREIKEEVLEETRTLAMKDSETESRLRRDESRMVSDDAGENYDSETEDKQSVSKRKKAADEFAILKKSEEKEVALDDSFLESEKPDELSDYGRERSEAGDMAEEDAEAEDEEKPAPVFSKSGYKTVFDYAAGYMLGNKTRTSALLYAPSVTIRGETVGRDTLQAHFAGFKEQNPAITTVSDLYDAGSVQIFEGSFGSGSTGKVTLLIKAAGLYPGFPGQTVCTVLLGKTAEYGKLPVSVNSTLFEDFILRRVTRSGDKEMLLSFYNKNSGTGLYELTGTPEESNRQYLIALFNSLGYYYRINAITW